MNMPNDPVMLLSVVNTQLRDFYPSFEELCDALGVDGESIRQKLSSINYEYDPETNQFV